MAKKIKICFVVPRAYYLFDQTLEKISDKVGGAQKQAFLFSTGLASYNLFDVHFIVADFGQKKNKMMIDGVTVWKSFNFKHNFITQIHCFYKSLKNVNADVYLFRSADRGVAFGTFLVKYLLKKKVIYMIASGSETSYVGNKKAFGPITAQLMNFVYKKSDAIIAQTKEQSILFTKNHSRNPDSIIKNIIDIEQEKNEEIQKDYSIWVGRLDKIKQPELFLELAKKIPNQKFIMIAPIVLEHQKYGIYLKKEILKIKNIEYIEFVKPKEMMLYYQKAKLYVTTSETEGFSNTMMEAMAVGCPVLSYKVDPENIIRNFQLGYCSYAEKTMFFKAFEQLIDNEDKLNIMGKNARDYIMNNHSKEIEISKLVDLISAL